MQPLAQVGHIGYGRELLQLPVSFNTDHVEDWPQDMPSPGRCLSVAFHTACTSPPALAPAQVTLNSASEAHHLWLWLWLGMHCLVGPSD